MALQVCKVSEYHVDKAPLRSKGTCVHTLHISTHMQMTCSWLVCWPHYTGTAFVLHWYSVHSILLVLCLRYRLLPATKLLEKIASQWVTDILLYCRLVPDLLSAILPLLPLGKAGSGKKDKASNSSSGKQPSIKCWNSVHALQKLGTKHASRLLPWSTQLLHHDVCA